MTLGGNLNKNNFSFDTYSQRNINNNNNSQVFFNKQHRHKQKYLKLKLYNNALPSLCAGATAEIGCGIVCENWPYTAGYAAEKYKHITPIHLQPINAGMLQTKFNNFIISTCKSKLDSFQNWKCIWLLCSTNYLAFLMELIVKVPI